MPSIRSILSILALGSVMVDNPTPRRIISKALYVVALVILSALLTGALLLSIVTFLHQLFLSNGVPRVEAALYVMGIIFAITAAAAVLTISYVRKLLQEVDLSAKKPVPLTSHLGGQAVNVAEAFFNGLIGRRRY